MARKLLNVATFGLAGAIFGGKKKKAEAAPAPEPVMPIADDEAVRLARKRSIAAQMRRGGRGSTMLTTPSTGSVLGG